VSSKVTVQILDLAGREVARPASGTFEAGSHDVRWEGIGAGGKVIPAGWYVVRVRANDFTATHMLLLLK